LSVRSLEIALDDRPATDYRRLRQVAQFGLPTISLSGKQLLNFASNDYLGLSGHEELVKRSCQYAQRHGAGIPSSRLLAGNVDLFDQVEQKLAAFKGTESALILPSGFQTNVSVIGALGRENTLLAADRLSHSSILTGLQLSRGRWLRYAHNDSRDLSSRLEALSGHDFFDRWLITESVFSMDGDRACFDDLTELARREQMHLYVDEAHATGVLGEDGRGLAFDMPESTIVMGTFGKAFGSFGAYIACSKMIREFLVNFCSGLIYSTALPPAVLGAIDAALDLVPEMHKERKHLTEISHFLRESAQQAGFDTASSSTHIIPLLIGKEESAIDLAQHLENDGIFAPVIRYPTVPRGSARIRVSLTAKHTREHIGRLLSSLSNWRTN